MPPDALQLLQQELEGVEKQLQAYEDLNARREQLKTAIRVLQGGSIAPPIPQSQPRSRTRSRRSGALDETEIVHAIHSNGEPASAVQIRDALGLSGDDSNRLSVKLGAMVKDGILKRQGERRASRYTPA